MQEFALEPDPDDPRPTLIGRAKGKRFGALSGAERIVFGGDAGAMEEEGWRQQRKASLAEVVA